MTTLSAVHIADLCRRVGFGRPALYTAIATALATSGGNQAYEHAIYPGPVALYKGLWGVDLCEHGEYVGENLADPQRATEAAYDLTQEHGGFGWCPAYRSGAYVHHLDRAMTASSMIPKPAPQHTAIAVYDRRDELAAGLAANGALHNVIGRHGR